MTTTAKSHSKTPATSLDHEDLDVYKLAIEFVAVSLQVAGALPRGHGSLADQLKRAGISIPANIAEANGRTGLADRRHFYAIARGSATESAALLDVVALVQQEPRVIEGKAILRRVVQMLTKLCWKLSSTNTNTSTNRRGK
jgi:four helix bundle protein